MSSLTIHSPKAKDRLYGSTQARLAVTLGIKCMKPSFQTQAGLLLLCGQPHPMIGRC